MEGRRRRAPLPVFRPRMSHKRRPVSNWSGVWLLVGILGGQNCDGGGGYFLRGGSGGYFSRFGGSPPTQRKNETRQNMKKCTEFQDRSLRRSATRPHLDRQIGQIPNRYTPCIAPRFRWIPSRYTRTARTGRSNQVASLWAAMPKSIKNHAKSGLGAKLKSLKTDDFCY